jgi:hypothetical protein
MLPEVEKLLIIQDRDIKILAIQKELESLPEEEAEIREKLAADQKAMEAAKKAVMENEVAVKNLEIEIQTRRNSIARLKVQQFEIKKNEEFRAMGVEIERYGADVSALEDRELDLMEKGEGLKKAHVEAEQCLAASRRMVEEDIEAIAKRRENLETEVGDLASKRAEQAKGVDPDTLDLYDRLFRSKGGLVVVGLTKDGQCTGCHVRVIKSTIVAVKSEKEIAHCENCGRILYWTEEA